MKNDKQEWARNILQYEKKSFEKNVVKQFTTLLLTSFIFLLLISLKNIYLTTERIIFIAVIFGLCLCFMRLLSKIVTTKLYKRANSFIKASNFSL